MTTDKTQDRLKANLLERAIPIQQRILNYVFNFKIDHFTCKPVAYFLSESDYRVLVNYFLYTTPLQVFHKKCPDALNGKFKLFGVGIFKEEDYSWG